MLISTSNGLEDKPAPLVTSGEPSTKSVALSLTSLVTRFNIFARFYPSMIGRIEHVDTVKRMAIVYVPRTDQQIRFRFSKSQQPTLLANASKLVEIHGKIKMDNQDNPVAVYSVFHVGPVDTSDINVSDVLPDFLRLVTRTVPLINVDLDETKRFYCAELEELNVFACALSREHLKERLRERIEVCWDESVREDSSDLSQKAWELRERLHSTFSDGKNDIETRNNSQSPRELRG